ncbi:MAG TPA: hypothetical protein PKD09_19950 [Aggregatilinea sp.]|uniref:hypothetical protein n=1 Tax=Aggregatilinea sp. TaxID=2806333 RepID=UPI002C841AB5|nr:hypothetical protein [Aggregatilinea sp.]HML23940.1 hypothetical protein [Aggregatilinea sp.]
MSEDYRERPEESGPAWDPEPEVTDESTRPVAVPDPDAAAEIPAPDAAEDTAPNEAVQATDRPAAAPLPVAEEEAVDVSDADLDDAYLDEMEAADDLDAPEPDPADQEDQQEEDPDEDDEANGVEESTRPKAPAGLHEAIVVQQAAEQAEEPPQLVDEPASTFAYPDLPYGTVTQEQPGGAVAISEPPYDPAHDTAPVAAVPVRRVPRLMLAVVMLGSICMCATLVGLAAVAGYRDGLATNDVKLTQTMATELDVQYQAAQDDIEAGRYGLAMERLSWIVETIQPGPEYMLDSREQWAYAATMNAITPTLPATATPTATPTQEPTLATEEPVVTEAPPAPVDQNDPAYMYEQAEQAARLGDFETTIAWAESLRAAAPDYRPADVQAMLMNALTKQGTIYLRGANPDGEDKLLRGILLIYRADDLGTVQPETLLYEADFAERYLNARNYLDGGNAAAAAPILQRLCDENCDWSYRGESVRDLMAQAGLDAGS